MHLEYMNLLADIEIHVATRSTVAFDFCCLVVQAFCAHDLFRVHRRTN